MKPFALRGDWTRIGESDHFVAYYRGGAKRFVEKNMEVICNADNMGIRLLSPDIILTVKLASDEDSFRQVYIRKTVDDGKLCSIASIVPDNGKTVVSFKAWQSRDIAYLELPPNEIAKKFIHSDYKSLMIGDDYTFGKVVVGNAPPKYNLVYEYGKVKWFESEDELVDRINKLIISD